MAWAFGTLEPASSDEHTFPNKATPHNPSNPMKELHSLVTKHLNICAYRDCLLSVRITGLVFFFLIAKYEINESIIFLLKSR